MSSRASRSAAQSWRTARGSTAPTSRLSPRRRARSCRRPRRNASAGTRSRDAEAADPVHHRQHHRADGQNVRSRVAYNNSWSKTDGLLPTLNATRVGPRTRTTARPQRLPELVALGQPGLGRDARSCSSACAVATTRRDQHDTNVTRAAALHLRQHHQRRLGSRSGQTCSVAGFSASRPPPKVTRNQQTRCSFQADGTVYGNVRRRAPDQVRRAGRPRRQQRAER